MKYSFDTSAFINPWRRYYPQNRFPSLWKKIDELIQSGDIVASEEVYQEVRQKDDELLRYLKNRRELFRAVDEEQQQTVSDIVNTFNNWIDPHSLKNNADPYVVALAMQQNLVVVTYEKGGSSENVKIPYVCSYFQVGCLDFLGFLDDIDLML